MKCVAPPFLQYFHLSLVNLTYHSIYYQAPRHQFATHANAYFVDEFIHLLIYYHLVSSGFPSNYACNNSAACDFDRLLAVKNNEQWSVRSQWTLKVISHKLDEVAVWRSIWNDPHKWMTIINSSNIIPMGSMKNIGFICKISSKIFCNDSGTFHSPRKLEFRSTQQLPTTP